MDKNSVYVLSPEWVLFKEKIKKMQFYLFNIKNGDVFVLNEVSFQILSSIDGKNTLEEVYEKLVSIYDVDKNKLIKDTDAILQKCIDLHIIKLAEVNHIE